VRVVFNALSVHHNERCCLVKIVMLEDKASFDRIKRCPTLRFLSS
jgi:hypothetical protein